LGPNPNLRDIALGEVTVYKWKDKAGRDWKGGLFKPVPYDAGRRYPLVIQTHGFSESDSGRPVSFRRRSLLEHWRVRVWWCCKCRTVRSLKHRRGPCNVDGYEAAVSELVKRLVDSARIGIIGFSRTCFYVMKH